MDGYKFIEASEDDMREILSMCGCSHDQTRFCAAFTFLFLACAMLRNDANSASPLPTFVHRLLARFAVSLRSLSFNDRYDAAFHWIAQFIQTILGQRRSLNARHQDNVTMIR